MKKQKEPVKAKGKIYEESFLAYLNNRCLRKPRGPVYERVQGRGFYFMGFGRNQMAIFSPKRRKLKGWMRKFFKK
jgi:hypothetical protein